jgi:DNA repair exonuclease SbcCD nuclease subunit
MSNLFKKVACFTDIHFGLRNNSRQHNTDCEEFVLWFIKEAKKAKCETCIFLGDWHHHRASINVSTMNYTMSNLEFLSKAFTNVFVIMGNHDLFYRDKREINSVAFGNLYDNVHIVNNILTEGDVSIIPWLVQEEWKEMPSIKSKYIFGHFELGGFQMNQLISMPDTGGLQKTHFRNQEYVFSGHFHNRQQQKNVIYMGNAFPHNYSDTWQDDRGMMILEWGGEPQYIAWPNAPSFKTINLSKLIDDPEKYLKPKTNIRVTLDVDISYEEATHIKQVFTEKYNLREIVLMPQREDEYADDWSAGDDAIFESVDQIVLNELTAIKSTHINNQKLIDIYTQLTV